MEQKTRINAEEGKQEMIITREFDLPLELLFKAYVEPEIVEEWMTTKVVKLESKKHGSYQFEKKDGQGTIRHSGSKSQRCSLLKGLMPITVRIYCFSSHHHLYCCYCYCDWFNFYGNSTLLLTRQKRSLRRSSLLQSIRPFIADFRQKKYCHFTGLQSCF